MDLNELSEFIKKDGGKFIIIEQGKPNLIIMSFEEYKNKIVNRSTSPVVSNFNNPKPVQAEGTSLPETESLEEVGIEDLPLE